jgi:hypothetical protein
MSQRIKLLMCFTWHKIHNGSLVSVRCRHSFLQVQTMEARATAPEARDETGTTLTAFLLQHPLETTTPHLPAWTWIEP